MCQINAVLCITRESENGPFPMCSISLPHRCTHVFLLRLTRLTGWGGVGLRSRLEWSTSAVMRSRPGGEKCDNGSRTRKGTAQNECVSNPFWVSVCPISCCRKRACRNDSLFVQYLSYSDISVQELVLKKIHLDEVLTQPSLTLHYSWRIFYYQHYIYI